MATIRKDQRAWLSPSARDLVSLMAILWRADRGFVAALAIVAVALGLLPNLMIVSTGRFAGASESAVRNGLTSPAGGRAGVALVTMGAVFVANSVLMAYMRWMMEVLNSAYAGQFSTELAAACLSPRYIDVLEESSLAGRISDIGDFERSGVFMQVVPAARMVLSRRIGGIGAAIILFSLSWWAPLLLSAGWFLARWGSSRWVGRAPGSGDSGAVDGLRRAQYMRGMATDAATAKELRVFGWAPWVAGLYAKVWWEAMASVWAARRARSREFAIGISALLLAHAIVFGWLGWQAWAGHVGMSATVMVGMAILGTADLGFLGDQEWRLARAAKLAGQLRSVIQATSRDGDSEVVSALAFDRRSLGAAVDVSLTDVCFSYLEDQVPVLDCINLHIAAGQSIAIVGENGAGKSTLLKVIVGLYKADHGVVQLDGRDIADVDFGYVERRVGIVFQNFLRYELRLQENVGFGGSDLLANRRELVGALFDAGGSGVLARLPAGWETILASGYEGGVDLSGGEWQKIALARALTAVRAGAGVLILDEPTAALDVRAEAELFDRFLDVAHGVTTILVSHRLYGVRRADRIVVLDGARIVEDGTHDELMALGGRYSTMFRLQAERFASDGKGTADE